MPPRLPKPATLSAPSAALLPGGVLLAAVMLLLAVFACGRAGEGADTAPPKPPVEAEIRAAATGGKLQVAVTIPSEHHAYLDRGTDGVLIPIEFLWKKVVQSGRLAREPKLLTRPKGSFDREMGATVLRGPGEFTFAVEGKATGLQIPIRTQLCNDRTRVCYPPSIQTVSVTEGAL